MSDLPAGTPPVPRWLHAWAVLVCVAVMTSRAWAEPSPVDHERLRFRRLALILPVLVYAQIVFGALVRHLFSRSAQRLHVLFAFLVLAVVVWTVKGLWDRLA